MERVPGETSNDYSDRLIRQAALWYSDHLAGTGLRALLLTDDRDNLRRAQKAGVPVMRGEVRRGPLGGRTGAQGVIERSAEGCWGEESVTR